MTLSAYSASLDPMVSKQGSTPEETPIATDDGLLPPNPPSPENALAVRGFQWTERILLILVAAMTLAAAGAEIVKVWQTQSIDLADILLMFLYTEVIGMIAVFYTGRGSPFIYPIFIAITALARLIVLQGKDMAPQNILFEAAAILLLALSVLVIARAGES